jgi:hypothetical protein
VLVHLSTLGLNQFAIDNSQFAIKKLRIANCELRIEMAFGYCCGVEWLPQGWKYEIVTGNDNITVWGSELIGTGNLRSLTKEKPVFRLGELVEFRFHGDGPPIRIVQGIHLITNCWFYSVEWMSPGISEKGDEVFTSKDSIAWVTDYDLERV